MSEALDWSVYENLDPGPIPPEPAASRPELRLVEPYTEPAPIKPDDDYIALLVAAGETVVSYKSCHRWPDGRPRRFGPTYPL